MMLAVHDGQRARARPGGRAFCPLCQKMVIAKCGRVVAWHWAHEARSDCDDWAEPDTAWHHGWQDAAPLERREVIIGPHRADLLARDGSVVELQHGSISPAEIEEREIFYGADMTWLFDAREAAESERLDLRLRDYRGKPPGAAWAASFRWKHPRKTIAWCGREVLLDVGNGLVLWIKKIHMDEPPYGGWGWMFTEDHVKDWMRG